MSGKKTLPPMSMPGQAPAAAAKPVDVEEVLKRAHESGWVEQAPVANQVPVQAAQPAKDIPWLRYIDTTKPFTRTFVVFTPAEHAMLRFVTKDNVILGKNGERLGIEKFVVQAAMKAVHDKLLELGYTEEEIANKL
ncbi:hypothetical protein [Chitinibacter tainanensis]|uniref:hypothetical protein n=1 Tax=Chitinibacter tainanensis TaxID=230667 RepID=UPI00042A037A|nr:hypothetical protein [Chitinibacter tainanensis]